MPGEPWAPTLDGVARHIPRRTRDTTTPGGGTLLGTFTEATTPTAEQAQADLDAAVRTIIAAVGPCPASGLDATRLAALQAAYRDAAEWRAAADIEVAYPNRDADVAVAAALDDRAVAALSALRAALASAGSGTVDTVPCWQFPAAATYGDYDPDTWPIGL